MKKSSDKEDKLKLRKNAVPCSSSEKLDKIFSEWYRLTWNPESQRNEFHVGNWLKFRKKVKHILEQKNREIDN